MEHRRPYAARMVLRSFLLGAGSIFDLLAPTPIVTPHVRPRAPSVQDALASDAAKIGRDMARAFEREREQAA